MSGTGLIGGGVLRRPAWMRSPRALLVFSMMPGLSLLNAMVGLALPLLLGPVAFGRYAIAVTLFQYCLILDFGVSQMIDRRLPALIALGSASERARFVDEMLWLRLYVAAAALSAGIVVLVALAQAGRLPFSPLDGALSVAAGLFFMIALGPAAICRAASRRGEFAAINAALMLMLALARPIGIVLDGATGCFALLAIGYGGLAFGVQRRMLPAAAHRPHAAAFGRVAREGMPLFLIAFVWAFYMTANRWVVSELAPEAVLGQFAFGSNIVYLIVGAIGALSQFYYPAITAASASGGAFAVSSRVTRDLALLTALVAVPTAFGIIAGPFMIGIVYPKFVGAVASVRLLLLAVPGLVLASWLMPLSISLGRRPWLDGMATYPAALVVLMGGTWLGYRHGGTPGAAWGLVLSALPLLVLQLAGLVAARLLRSPHAAALLGVAVAASLALWLLV